MRYTFRLFCCILSVLAVECLNGAGQRFEVTGATIAGTQQAIREGRTTCRGVVESYLKRIAAYDQRPIGGLRLNSGRAGGGRSM